MAEGAEREPGGQQVEALAETQLGVGGPAPSGPPAAAPPDFEAEGEDTFVGRVLGGLYQVERKLGEGGMGAVYLVRHVHLRKHFAVKVLAEQIAANRQAVERLHQEAVAASSIDHENIVDIVNFDITERDEVFIVMELLDGPSLAQVLETQGRLPPERALPIAVQIARALQAAHERGIVHRDLKPENVMLVQKGGRELVKVLDFGISKVRSAEAEQVRVTRTGQLVGTPLYMSPEQARGEKDVDHRADVYALGVMLYEMLTGTPPFDGANYFQLLWKHGNEEPEPPRARCPEADISEALEAVILKAMAKDPAERFQSMAEFEEALLQAEPQRALPQGSFSGSVPAPRPSGEAAGPGELPASSAGGRGRALLLGGLAAAVVLGGAALAVVSGGGERGGDGAAREATATATASDEAAPGEATKAPKAPTPPAEPAPARDEGLAAASPQPVELRVTFRSEPPGAEVWLGEERLGVTPLEAGLPVELAGVERRVRFRKRGFREAAVRAELRDGATVEARLRRLARPAGRKGSGGGALPIKTEL